MRVVREWKRDGTTNELALARAVKNLSQFGLDRFGDAERDEVVFEDMLNSGCICETRLARYAALGVEFPPLEVAERKRKRAKTTEVKNERGVGESEEARLRRLGLLE